MTARDAIPEGMTWGGSISADDLRPGDEFAVKGTPRMGRLSGTVTKVNRSSIVYETVYAPSPTHEQRMTLKALKLDVIGGRVRRGDVIYEIVSAEVQS